MIARVAGRIGPSAGRVSAARCLKIVNKMKVSAVSWGRRALNVLYTDTLQ
jgi:hypothetical protein